MNAQTGQDYLDFAKQSYGDAMTRQSDMDALTKQVVEQQMGISDQQMDLANKQVGIQDRQQALAEQVAGKQMALSDAQLGIANQQQQWATEDRQRYEDTFVPIENQYVQEATNYATPEKQAEAAAAAKADVQQQADAERAATQRQQASMGVNPNSGRFAGIDRASELQTALATAGAQNNARTQVQDKGLALMGDVVNMGRGLPVQSAQATSLGLGASQASGASNSAALGAAASTSYGPASSMLSTAGSTLSSALGASSAANANFLNSQSIMGSGYSAAMQGYSNQASILNQQYANQLNAWNAQQQADAANSSGIFGAIGTGIGAFAALSSKKFKRDRKPAQAGLDAVKKMPIQDYRYKDGVSDGGQVEHTGAMAEDFQKATGKGDGTTIPLQDAIGITMKAVQELDDKVDKMASAMPGLGGKRSSKQEMRRAA